jgi:hypothetical protein
MLKIVATIIIPIATLALPALLALFSFYAERRRERKNIETSLRTEMGRIRALLVRRLIWLEKDGSHDLPLLPFETSLYDAQVGKIGACDPSFTTVAVSFYGIVHFLNALQATREAYARADALECYFNTYAKTVRRALLRYEDLRFVDVRVPH